VHLAAALPNAPFVEYFGDDQVLNFRRLIDRQLELRGGDLVVPSDPGLGFGFDEAAVAKTTTVPWAENK
jgi:L-alanine-DL-glutamate epimerase-like enolase superfamily enzyme